MSQVKLAFLGCGDVAQRDYLPEFHRLSERAEIVAVCGRTRERVQRTAERYAIPHIYTNYISMLHQTDADAVVNLLPMQLHYDTNLAILRAGKHLYSEKTVAASAQQGQLLKHEAQTRGLLIVAAPCIMIWPQIILAKQLIEEGKIGEVHSARGLGHGGVPPWDDFASDPAHFFARGGGPHRDMGVYPLHALTGLLGRVQSVKAMNTKAQNDGFVIREGPFAGKHVPMEEEDTWLMVLDHGNRVITTVEANNSVQASQAPQLEIFGLKGTIAVNLINGASPVQLMNDGKWRDIPVQHMRPSGPDHILGVEHLVDCCVQGMQPILNIEHASHVVEVIDAAARSAADGHAAQIGPKL